MSAYKVSSRTLNTGREICMVTDESGHAVSGTSTRTNCEKICQLLNDNNVQSLSDWRKLCRKIRTSYIVTFCCLHPDFK